MVQVELGQLTDQAGAGMIIIMGEDDLSQEVNTNAQTAWVQVEHPMSLDPLTFDAGKLDPQFLTDAKVEQIPTVLFYEYNDQGQSVIITRLEGYHSTAQIANKYLGVLNDLYPPNGSSNGQPPQQYQGNPLGMALFDVPALAWIPNLPTPALLALALGAAYGATRAKGTAGKVGLGAAAAVFGMAYLKAKDLE